MRPPLSISVVFLCAAACDCSENEGLPGPALSGFETQTADSVAALTLVPFDANREDLNGPRDHGSRYGKLPEIVVSPRTSGFDVALQSYDAVAPRTFVLRFEEAGGGHTLTRALEAPTLGLLLGFVTAADGSFYYATGTPDEDVSASYPAEGQHRGNVVRVYHADPNGQVLFDVDLDLARARFAPTAEPLIHPGVASSARLGLAGGQLALVHGINTEHDARIDARHQKAISTYLDATTGDITGASGIWCSHSFDERYLAHGDDLYELHLGDAYPRAVVASRVRSGTAGPEYRLYRPKGSTGNNNTFTRLGGIASIESGAGSGGYLVLVATEHGNDTTATVNGSRDLALVRTVVDFASGASDASLDATFGTTFDVTSGDASVTNRVLWLTSYDAGSSGTEHAERPKLVAIGGGEFLVLWERWTTGSSQTFDGTYAMRIDGSGTILASETRVSDSHLPRGDDAFALGGRGCWLTGDSQTGLLTLHCVSSALVVEETVLP